MLQQDSCRASRGLKRLLKMKRNARKKMNIGQHQIHQRRMESVVDVDVTPTSGMLRVKKGAVSPNGLRLLEDGHHLEQQTEGEESND